MATKRCSTCSIDYPSSTEFENCLVCLEKTHWFPHESHDPDWKQAVELAKAPNWEPADKVFQWRLEQLIESGYDEQTAFHMAVNRYVDIGKARDLAEKATPELAARILL